MGLWRNFLEPIPAEKKQLLEERWRELAPELRSVAQGFGQQCTGCGALIGAFPRCDFDCKGCYLGSRANAAKPFDEAEIDRQLAHLRRHLGPKGNLQITDGEVTLMAPKRLVALLRRARELGMIPMLMTHGDSFRRRPELLPRLVSEGGLTEVSIHVDSSQKGRRGFPIGDFAVGDEAALHPLRDEFAAMIRQVRRRTGVRLRAATTVTVSRDNLDGVGDVVAWCLANRDAFGILSFQPLAQVGRTLSHLEGITHDELWSRIGAVLEPHGFSTAQRGAVRFGHLDCTRTEPMVAYQRRGEGPRLFSMLRPGDPADEAIVQQFLGRGFGGVVFRDDRPLDRLGRALGLFRQAPGWFLGPFRRWLVGRLHQLGTGPARLMRDLALGAVRIDSFAVASHSFMSAAELDTETGRERLAACVFRVPVGDRMVSMCEVNARGLRQQLYDLGTSSGFAAFEPQDQAVAAAFEPPGEQRREQASEQEQAGDGGELEAQIVARETAEIHPVTAALGVGVGLPSGGIGGQAPGEATGAGEHEGAAKSI
ncbi:MAG: radical SAM protein [Acidobacteriota bacterium]